MNNDTYNPHDIGNEFMDYLENRKSGDSPLSDQTEDQAKTYFQIARAILAEYKKQDDITGIGSHIAHHVQDGLHIAEKILLPLFCADRMHEWHTKLNGDLAYTDSPNEDNSPFVLLDETAEFAEAAAILEPPALGQYFSQDHEELLLSNSIRMRLIRLRRKIRRYMVLIFVPIPINHQKRRFGFTAKHRLLNKAELLRYLDHWRIETHEHIERLQIIIGLGRHTASFMVSVIDAIPILAQTFDHIDWVKLRDSLHEWTGCLSRITGIKQIRIDAFENEVQAMHLNRENIETILYAISIFVTLKIIPYENIEGIIKTRITELTLVSWINNLLSEHPEAAKLLKEHTGYDRIEV